MLTDFDLIEMDECRSYSDMRRDALKGAATSADRRLHLRWAWGAG